MEYKVSVFMLSYNHEKYIEKSLQSVLSQKVNFKYEIVVHDDASTDKSQEIIKKYAKKYPDIIHPILQEKNLFSQGIDPENEYSSNLDCEYIALCECDDFWCDDNKLQIQVDFMDSNPDYSICGHASYNAFEDGTLLKRQFRRYSKSVEIKIEDVVSGWIYPTASILYRRSSRDPFIIPFMKDAPCGDYPLAVYMALKGRAYYFSDCMSVYRKYSLSSLSLIRIKERNIDTAERFVALLARIDEYTNGQFCGLLRDYKARILLAAYIRCGMIKEAKSGECRELYLQHPIFNAVKAFLYKNMPQLVVWLVSHGFVRKNNISNGKNKIE